MTDAPSKFYVVFSGEFGGLFLKEADAVAARAEWSRAIQDHDTDVSPQVSVAPLGVTCFNAGHYEVEIDPEGNVTYAAVESGVQDDQVICDTEGMWAITVSLNPKVHTLVHAIEYAQNLLHVHREATSQKKARKRGHS